jgi:hypothetical protein
VLSFPLHIKLQGAVMKGCTISYLPPTTQDGRQTLDRRLDELVAGLSDEQRSQVTLERPELVKGKCFLATAAHGSDGCREVATLQEFRDTVLRPTLLGDRLIRAYETLSPPLARFVERSALARRLLRSLLVDPAARFAESVLKSRLRRE